MPLSDISFRFLFDTFLGVLLVVAILIVVVLYYSFYQFKKLIHHLQWSNAIDDKVSDAIVYGSDNEYMSAANDAFYTFAKNNSFRDLFLEKLVASEKKFSGLAATEIYKLFITYDLEKEAYKNLHQKKAHRVAGGIKELSAMHVQKALPQITSFLTHPSRLVYQEAQYSMITFKGFEGLQFLHNTTTILSEWQQLRLLLTITHIPEEGADLVPLWLKSNNNSVVVFTIRLVKKFQMLSFYPLVLELLNHPSQMVKIQAVSTLQALENSNTLQHLTEGYSNQPEDVKVEILRMLKISKDVKSINFLKERLIEPALPKIRIYAAEALFDLNQKEFLCSLVADQSTSEQLVQIIKHAMQEKV